jgi:hypothetical protein
MPYRFVTERADYTDFSSGQVFYSQAGRPAFPARLASEIFQRCLAIRKANQLTNPITIYDPCCGAAHHLDVLAYLHWDSIGRIVASDIEAGAVELARRNLSLLSLNGMDRRIDELFNLLQQYGKESHQESLKSAQTLREQLAAAKTEIETRVFQANALSSDEMKRGLQGQPVDVVFADVPYGQQSPWLGVAGANPLGGMLEALLSVLQPTSLVAIAADKAQKISHAGYKRVEQLKLGKRQAAILRPI